MDDFPAASEDDSFSELLRRVREGNGDAARQLVEQYESAIRVAVRTRLSDPRLRRQFDSLDVCQSVLLSFFVSAAAGRYDLHEPAQLVALLTEMARKKLAMRVRAHSRQRRDIGRTSALSDTQGISDPATSADTDPVRNAMGRELLERAFQMMSPEIHRMAELRSQETQWIEIARIMGGTPEARRKQFQRAVDRIAQTLEEELTETGQ